MKYGGSRERTCAECGSVFLDESYTEGCRMVIELPKVR